MLLQLKKINTSIGTRDLFAIDRLSVYDGDRIGIVGLNGSGKSTLLNIIAGNCEPDCGELSRNCSLSYFRQLDDEVPDISREAAKPWDAYTAHEHSSGGEKVRRRLAAVFAEQPQLLILDEPTANLDVAGIETLQEVLTAWQGALMVVSHDRELLDSVCTKIWEIAGGAIREYAGNYADYCREKQRQQLEKQRAVDNYTKERARLRRLVIDTSARSARVKRTPSRMGNSEARLHKMGDQRAKGNIDKAANALRSRLERFERPEGPETNVPLIFDLLAENDIYSRNVASTQAITRNFGGKTILNEVAFSLGKGEKIALTGPNGCGKTTLLQAIINRDPEISIAARARIGYLDQNLKGLNDSASILDNVRISSVYDEVFVRTLLARLKFRTDDVHKKVSVLSGGERVRVLLAKIMLSNCNLLIFDEPTNFLDIPSLEAIEAVLADFTGTLLFTTHDRQFVRNVATAIWYINDGAIDILEVNA